jgi:hypothetical protein
MSVRTYTIAVLAILVTVASASTRRQLPEATWISG